MKIIGLTGGIATGKTTVGNMLRELGIPVIDADLIAREIVQPGKPAYEEIIAVFGHGVVQPDGNLDRKRLGAIVFANATLLSRLNKITHPRIAQEIKKRLAHHEEEGTPLVVVDIPLLLEGKSHIEVDEVWLVSCDSASQLQRLQTRDQISAEEAQMRIKAQMPLTEKAKYAHRIIDNSGDINNTRRQVEEFLQAALNGVQ
ncbi:MAG: dephospho-CoA kinase [bacterium]|jgi:dephospho-CoA kinase